MQTQLLTAIGPVTDQTARAIRDLVGHCARALGTAPISEQPLMNLQSARDRSAHILAIYENCLVGYMNVDLSAQHEATVEYAIRPEFPDPELADKLLQAGQYVADQHQGDYSVWLHNPTVECTERFLGQQFRTVRSLSRRALTLSQAMEIASLPTDTSPANQSASSESPLAIRTFVVGQDEEKWVAANAQAFAWHPEQGKLTLADLRDRMKESWFTPQSFFVVDNPSSPDQIAGFAWVKAEPLAPRGEIYAIATLPSVRGTGLGRSLLTHSLNYLTTQGYKEADLYVESTNVKAVALYDSLGFREIERHIKLTRTKTSPAK